MRGYLISFCVVLFAASAGAQAPKPAGNPCALLTKADIQEATGIAVSEGAVMAQNKSVCNYPNASGGAINLMLADKGPSDSAEKMVSELNKRKISAQLVPGIGDGAYTANHGYGMQQVGAYKGSKHVIVTVMIPGAPEAKSKTAAEKLARKAAGKL